MLQLFYNVICSYSVEIIYVAKAIFDTRHAHPDVPFLAINMLGIYCVSMHNHWRQLKTCIIISTPSEPLMLEVSWEQYFMEGYILLHCF